MPIMANHSNPEKDGAWSYGVRYSKTKHFGRISQIPSGNVLVSVSVLYYDVPLSTKVAVFRHFDGRDGFSHKCCLILVSNFWVQAYKTLMWLHTYSYISNINLKFFSKYSEKTNVIIIINYYSILNNVAYWIIII